MNVFDVLQERGFVEQVNEPERVRDLLGKDQITCYIGFDPTATSLHVGSLVPVMALWHVQEGGHRPIVLIGGGTALIGDPSGKTEMRQILTKEQVNFNAECIRRQLSRYLDFKDDKALMLNNADWLTRLNYIEFLRDIGRHFSVNRMLAAESYRMRFEKGLNFIEFNYMLLQAYDFLYLFQHYDCVLQMGGNDQWGNMLAGCELIRRVEGKDAYCVTFPLITTSSGHKMGKTERGTVWLDAELTSPYEFYQFWVNTEDEDVKRFLLLFTTLPVEEIEIVDQLANEDLNVAKSVLAYETTRITHGIDAARAAWRASIGVFRGRTVDPAVFPSSSIPRSIDEDDLSAIPSMFISREILESGIMAYELFHSTGLCVSRSEARRLILQGGAYVNERPVKTVDEIVSLKDADGSGRIMLRKGKKKYFLIQVRDQ
ncbi:MAG: tyrosine--tRNA ligase [Syntrophales bacterium]|nr:tyrosine--tRNA ligase [Syntrophales bacterium]